ncbi:MAG: lipopolysaccharide biosynthesis protein [Anaerolineae bacterium]|nr:lipopolysaccharide biosynthesis protein [Anaerolineae bacterium]
MTNSWLNRWVKNNRILLTNTSSLVITTVVTSGLGFVYWWLAAKTFSTQAVGVASAAIAAMTLLGIIGKLGFGTLLVGELPRQRANAGSMVMSALVIVASVSTILGILFAWAAPLFSKDLQSLAADGFAIGIFAIGVLLTAVTLVFDQAVIGLLQGELQLWRNVVFSLTKLLLLPVVARLVAAATGMDIYGTWLLGNVISVLVLAGIFIAQHKRIFHKLDGVFIRQFGRIALQHHVLDLSLQISAFSMPLLVTVVLSASTNAKFYIAWLIASVLFAIPTNLTVMLYALGSADPEVMLNKTPFTLRISFLVGVAANIVIWLGAYPILNLFGADYATSAQWTLRILCLGIFPWIIRAHYVAIVRAYRQTKRATTLMLFGCALELALAAIGGLINGLTGLSIGWFLAVTIQALIVLPAVYRVSQNQHYYPVEQLKIT